MHKTGWLHSKQHVGFRQLTAISWLSGEGSHCFEKLSPGGRQGSGQAGQRGQGFFQQNHALHQSGNALRRILLWPFWLHGLQLEHKTPHDVDLLAAIKECAKHLHHGTANFLAWHALAPGRWLCCSNCACPSFARMSPGNKDEGPNDSVLQLSHQAAADFVKVPGPGSQAKGSVHHPTE